MADRYGYLSFVGLFLILCWGAVGWSEQLHLRPAWLAAASVIVLLAIAAVTHRQIGYWRDSYALWSRSLQVTSPNYEAENNLGVVMMNDDRLAEALPHLRAAVALNPLSPINNLNLAICEQRHGDLTQAIEHYQTVIRLTQNDIPNNVKWRYDAFRNMSFTYRDLGDSPHAQQSHEEAQNLLREYGNK
jgi:tetratricopeptide (TPR) repeat protein